MKQTFTACVLLVCIVGSIDAATVSRHGVSIDYDAAAYSQVFYNEWVRRPRPRRHVSQGPGDHFTPGELSFVFKAPSPAGSVLVRLTPTSHRSADYFNDTYPHASAEIRKLKELLRDRPAHPEIGASGERIDPVSKHSAFLVSKVQYFDFPWGSAIGFLHFSAQDEGAAAGFDPQFGWTRLHYYMHGLTADDRFYVSGTLDVVHPELERRENKRFEKQPPVGAEYAAYLKRATRLTERSREESFSPSLTVLHKLMGSLTIDPKQALPDKWHRFRIRRGIALEPE